MLVRQGKRACSTRLLIDQEGRMLFEDIRVLSMYLGMSCYVFFEYGLYGQARVLGQGLFMQSLHGVVTDTIEPM